jgi:hypothetical protein
MGPDPPANAAQEVYELHADRRLTVVDQPISAGFSATRMTGTWRVEGADLVLSADGPESASPAPRAAQGVGLESPRLFGDIPPPPQLRARYRILGCEGGVLRVQDEPNSVARFMRLAD